MLQYYYHCFLCHSLVLSVILFSNFFLKNIYLNRRFFAVLRMTSYRMIKDNRTKVHPSATCLIHIHSLLSRCMKVCYYSSKKPFGKILEFKYVSAPAPPLPLYLIAYQLLFVHRQYHGFDTLPLILYQLQ
jgi:hypothetical protein